MEAVAVTIMAAVDVAVEIIIIFINHEIFPKTMDNVFKAPAGKTMMALEDTIPIIIPTVETVNNMNKAGGVVTAAIAAVMIPVMEAVTEAEIVMGVVAVEGIIKGFMFYNVFFY